MASTSIRGKRGHRGLHQNRKPALRERACSGPQRQATEQRETPTSHAPPRVHPEHTVRKAQNATLANSNEKMDKRQMDRDTSPERTAGRPTSSGKEATARPTGAQRRPRGDSPAHPSGRQPHRPKRDTGRGPPPCNSPFLCLNKTTSPRRVPAPHDPPGERHNPVSWSSQKGKGYLLHGGTHHTPPSCLSGALSGAPPSGHDE